LCVLHSVQFLLIYFGHIICIALHCCAVCWLPVMFANSCCMCCACRVSIQNISLPPVPGLEPVALPQSSHSSSVELSSSANDNRSAIYAFDTDIDWNEP